MIDQVIVLGGGAVGSIYAAKLATRHDVLLVAKQAHVDAINRDGLRITGIETMSPRLRAATNVDAISPNTVILLVTKVHDSHTAVAPLVDKVRADTTIVCVQNGLASEDIVKGLVGDRCVVLRAITQFGAIFREPGKIEYTSAGYTLLEPSGRSADLADLLSASGLDGRVSANIKVEVWWKLIFNCVINPITAIVASDVGGITDPKLDPVKQLVIDECLRVARADGVTFDIDFMQTLKDVFGSARTIASMRQDLMKGKSTEIDHMNGAVVALGQRFGIPCPVNASLTALIKTMERRGVAE